MSHTYNRQATKDVNRADEADADGADEADADADVDRADNTGTSIANANKVDEAQIADKS